MISPQGTLQNGEQRIWPETEVVELERLKTENPWNVNIPTGRANGEIHKGDKALFMNERKNGGGKRDRTDDLFAASDN